MRIARENIVGQVDLNHGLMFCEDHMDDVKVLTHDEIITRDQLEKEDDREYYCDECHRNILAVADGCKGEEETCVLCGGDLCGMGNSPEPLADSGYCCDTCNTKVVAERMRRERMSQS